MPGVWTNAYALATFAAAIAGVASAMHALLHKRDPRSQLGWLVVCVTVPIVGAFFYWLLGVNRIQTRARRWQAGGRFAIDSQTAKLADAEPARAESMAALLRLGRAVTRWPIVAGNRVDVLHDGEQAYPAMLAAIDAAEAHVHLCTYIFETDRHGRQFVDALRAAAERGVAVRVLVDAIGERYARPRVGRLLRRVPGLEVARFLPLTLSLRGLRVNLRNHRKILAVDGTHGFTGGINLGGRHMVGDPENRRPTADLHFRFEGPAVSFMEECFDADWFFTTGRRTGWRPPRDSTGDGTALCRGIVDGPNEDLEKLQWVLLGALSVAKRRVRIMTPYFVPNREIIAGLTAAALRGVAVEIILPRRSNLPFVDWATSAMLWELLQHGVRVYRRPPPFAHSKLFMVDDYYVVIGSANLDPRSLRLNFEFNMEIFDSALGATLVAHFEAVRERCQELRLADNLARPLPVKLRDATFKLFAPYL
jgi:cardiolipin synthase